VASWKNPMWMMTLSSARLHTWVVTHKNSPSTLKQESKHAYESKFRA
jgi:hypothetical protein